MNEKMEEELISMFLKRAAIASGNELPANNAAADEIPADLRDRCIRLIRKKFEKQTGKVLFLAAALVFVLVLTALLLIPRVFRDHTPFPTIDAAQYDRIVAVVRCQVCNLSSEYELEDASELVTAMQTGAGRSYYAGPQGSGGPWVSNSDAYYRFYFFHDGEVVANATAYRGFVSFNQGWKTLEDDLLARSWEASQKNENQTKLDALVGWELSDDCYAWIQSIVVSFGTLGDVTEGWIQWTPWDR